MRVIKTSVLAAALACALVFALPGGAVTRGAAVTPAPSWAAFIKVTHKRVTTVCSGALVAPKWILTAAQCVVPRTQKGCKFLRPYRPKEVLVYLGRTSNRHRGTAYRVSAISVHGNRSIRAGRQCLLKNDVALLHLSKATTKAPLWIAPSPAAVTNGTNVALYGYGRTVMKKPKSTGSLRRTVDGDWTLDNQCTLGSKIGATCVDNQRTGGSAGAPGDAGGPWTMTVDSTPIEALVFSDYYKSKGYGTAPTQAATSTWLHTKLGIPNIAPLNIVHDPVSGDSWLIDVQGYRRPITDQEIYDCLIARGSVVSDVAASTIQLMAARTSSAHCPAGDSVLIAGAGDGAFTAPNDNLTTLLTAAGYQVTESAALPSDLGNFGQVWWVDTNAPSSAEQDQLVAFEQGGGGVFLTGERTCCEELNSADTAMINSMVGGGGVTAGQSDVCICNSAMPVNANVVGTLPSQPYAVTQWTPSQPGRMLGVPDSNVFSYYQPGDISTRKVVAAAWDRPSLVGGGRLVVFMDINWTELGYRAANWSSVAQNVALFLSGLSSPPGTPIDP